MNAQSSFERAGKIEVRERLVVIGNGMAGCRAVEEILERDPGRYTIAIFGAEPRVNYNRIMLSPVLAGEKSFDDIVINSAEWYAANVVGGPGAFLEVAHGFEDFARAMRRKFLLEIAGAAHRNPTLSARR